MKLKHYLTLMIAIAALSAHAQQPNSEGTYFYKEIGWTIKVPDGWTVLGSDKVNALNKKGMDALEKEVDGPIDDGLKNLLGFEKDRPNTFLSSIQPFKEEHPGDFAKNNKKIYDILYKTFTDAGIKVDTSTGSEVVAGLTFERFNVVLYSQSGDIILHEALYSALINGYDFGVTIAYNDKRNNAEMLNAFRTSTFK